MEPLLPGGCETVINLGEFWNSQLLYGRREEINRVNSAYRSCHAQATRYLSAAAAFMGDIINCAGEHTDFNKIDRFVQNFVQRELKIKKDGEKRGKKHIRLLSAVTPEGVVFYGDTLTAFAQRVFVFEDEYFAASRHFMQRLEKILLNSGAEIISCPSPMYPENTADQIIIPSIKAAVTVKNKFVPFKGEAYRTYHAKRFTDYEALSQNRQKLTFCKKAARDFIGFAANSMENAREIHNGLEEIYKSAMNFETLNNFTEELIGNII